MHRTHWAIALALVTTALLLAAPTTDAATKCGLADSDWMDLRNQLAGMVAAGWGPYLVRLAWVDAGSYSIIDGSGGSKATLKLVPPSGGHVSLQTCIDAMELLKENYPAISTADFWAFAGTVAVYESGGPIVPYRCGRTDYKTGEYNASMSAGRLPTGAFNSTQVRKTFTRIGLTDRETVAVIGGGHALGRCHYDRSGYVGPWTNNPLRFTNEFFTLLANSNWSLIVNPNGKTQYNNTDNTKMMLVSDYALWADPAYQSITLEYAKNASLFFSDFTAAYQKLLERGATLSVANSVTVVGDSTSRVRPLSTSVGAALSVQIDGSWKSVTLGSNILLRWNVRASAGYIDFEMSAGTLGWFAFGIGSGMASQDIYAYEPDLNNGAGGITDRISTSFTTPTIDIDAGGSYSVENFADISSTKADQTYKRVITFSRKLQTNDPNDHDIVSGTTTVTYAWSQTAGSLAYHGPNKGKVDLDFFSTYISDSRGEGSIIPTLQIIHGVLMLLCFGILMPYAIFVARNSSTYSNWLETHEKVCAFIYTEVFISAALAISGKLAHGDLSIHPNIGLGLLGITTASILSGYSIVHYVNIARLGEFLARSQPYIRATHIFIGYGSYLLALSNGYIGVTDLLTKSFVASRAEIFAAQALYVASVVSVPSFMFMFSKRHVMYKRLGRASSFEDDNELNKHKLKTAVDPVIAKLVEMTWKEFNDQIAQGKQYLVIRDVVYNIASNDWMNHHPGGVKILKSVIGTDCTPFFTGEEAASVGRIHNHSRVAEFQLKGLACGRIKGLNKTVSDAGVLGSENPTIAVLKTKSFADETGRMSRSPSFATSDVPLIQLLDHAYRLLPIKEKKLISAPTSLSKVYYFSLGLPKLEDEVKLAPGEHLSLQLTSSDGHLIERPYTPLKTVCKGSIPFIVRIRINGQFTPLLEKLDVGSTLRVKFMRSGEDGRNPVLLNMLHPTLCFGNVGMVSSGIGITPMMQLIDYYERNGPRREDGSPAFKLWLTAIFETEHDIVGKSTLDTFQETLGPALSIKWIARRVTGTNPSWYGAIHETIDEKVLAPNLPPPPKVFKTSLNVASAGNRRRSSSNVSMKPNAPLLSAVSENENPQPSEETRIVVSGNHALNEQIIDALTALNYSDCVMVLP